jgi:hypothetical protein
MQSQESDGIAAYLTRAGSDGASSRQVAAAVASAFEGIDQALAPIIGKRGVAALYKRTVHLASQTHSWLVLAKEEIPTAVDLTALEAALAAQTAADAAAAGTLLLQTFRKLLTTLVGPAIAERLLRPVWAIFLSGPSARDNM